MKTARLLLNDTVYSALEAGLNNGFSVEMIKALQSLCVTSDIDATNDRDTKDAKTGKGGNVFLGMISGEVK